jgi:hypothetical protein
MTTRAPATVTTLRRQVRGKKAFRNRRHIRIWNDVRGWVKESGTPRRLARERRHAGSRVSGRGQPSPSAKALRSPKTPSDSYDYSLMILRVLVATAPFEVKSNASHEYVRNH